MVVRGTCDVFVSLQCIMVAFFSRRNLQLSMPYLKRFRRRAKASYVDSTNNQGTSASQKLFLISLHQRAAKRLRFCFRSSGLTCVSFSRGAIIKLTVACKGQNRLCELQHKTQTVKPKIPPIRGLKTDENLRFSSRSVGEKLQRCFKFQSSEGASLKDGAMFLGLTSRQSGMYIMGSTCFSSCKQATEDAL